MARIRSIHPGIWTDEDFVEMSAHARLFMLGLWNEADDYGVLEWRPTKLKMRLAAVDAVDPVALMDEIASAGFIVRVERGGKVYAVIKNFRKWQRPKNPSAPLIEVDEEIVRIVNLRDGAPPTPALPQTAPSAGGNSAQREDVGGRREGEKEKDNPAPARFTTPGVEGGRAGAFPDEDLKDEGLPEGYYGTAERLRTAFRERGLDEPEMSRVAMWLEQGHSPATIVAVVRERLAASKAKPRGLSYFDRALSEAKPVREMPKPEPPPDRGDQVFVSFTDAAWDIYAAAYKARTGKAPAKSDRLNGRHFPVDLVPHGGQA
jgi:hypothetical protein